MTSSSSSTAASTSVWRYSSAFAEVGGNLFVVIFRAEALVLPDDRLHAQEVDDALEADSEPIGSWRQTGRPPTLVLISSTQRKKSAPILSILLTNTTRGTPYLSAWRQTVSVCGSTPWLPSSTQTAPSSTRKRSLDFDGEVDVAGRVDDVEALVAPEGGRRGGGDGDAALLLLLHPVHGRGAVVDFADLVRLAGIIEDALGGRRLPGVDVGHDAEIAVVFDSVAARHDP